ncbi:hypothetical protein [Marinomonas sp. MED121]|uniref:hypothetical protein n=1 Tax=Marinomonas sp. MED121 TaxID=314277 RepID=UPI00031F42AC|nr:hypothetical protein [Marinomonas sp. MED121]
MPTTGTSMKLTPLYGAILEVFASSKLVCDERTPKEKVQEELFPLACDFGGKVNDLYDGISNLATGKDGYLTQGVDLVSATIAKMKEKIVAYIDFLKIGETCSAFLDRICQEIFNLIPEAVKKIIGEIAPGLGDIKEASTQVINALNKVFIRIKTERLSDLAKYPVASDVIERIRSEIASVAIESGGRALFSTVKGAAAIATAGGSAAISAVVTAVIELFLFFKGIIDKEKMREKFRMFVVDCNKMKNKPLTDQTFRVWFRKSITDMPVLASYVVCMPSFGSPYNFINLIEAKKAKPTKAMKMGYSIKKAKAWIRRKKVGDFREYCQKSTYTAYRDLQSEAKSFISEGIQITSSKPGAMQALNAARGETNFIPGTDQEAFEAAVKKINRDNLKNGTTVKNFFGSQVKGIPGKVAGAVSEGVGELLIPE